MISRFNFRAAAFSAVLVLLSLFLTSPVYSSPPLIPAALSDVTLVSTGAVWRYLDDGSYPGPGWTGAAFDDSGWASGAAQLGYGDGDETTTISFGGNPANKYITTYFRRAFTTTHTAPLLEPLTLRLLRDDGAVVYLNGAEIFRSNMPAGTITSTTPASGAIFGAAESTFVTASISTSYLISGTNILAVEIHQANPASSDISFDLELSAQSSAGACANPDIRFAVIGDFGQAGQPNADVAAQIGRWSPDFITTVGDNNYDTGQASTIDANIGQYYHAYIGNYSGSYGAGAATNNFYPVPGNHDWYSAGGLQPYLDYFTLPGNERYYTFTRGPVQFFMLDSDANEPDGNSSGSVQAAWLQSQLAASTARWKLVLLHHAPFSSAGHGSQPALQWPYRQWGASAVLAGHDHTYERLLVDGLPYFVNGLGGKTLRGFGAPVPGSQLRYSDDYGAMLVEAESTCLSFQFITRTGQIVDTFTLKNNLPAVAWLPLIVKQ
ncbi:MAG: hypothetical protein D6768_11210 [Chloroflexi bacterium]|nr:MAG: hypothetical protein D6768_11210 [Chloroflexota bacterium]